MVQSLLTDRHSELAQEQLHRIFGTPTQHSGHGGDRLEAFKLKPSRSLIGAAIANLQLFARVPNHLAGPPRLAGERRIALLPVQYPHALDYSSPSAAEPVH